MKCLRKTLSIILLVCMVACLFPAAFADGEDSTVTVEANTLSSNPATASAGNVSVVAPDGAPSSYGVRAYAPAENGTAVADAVAGASGSVSVQGAGSCQVHGVDVGAFAIGEDSRSNAAASAGGDVTVSTGTGGYATGISASAGLDGSGSSSASATVGGSVTATAGSSATGAHVSAGIDGSGKSEAVVTVDGSVTASSDVYSAMGGAVFTAGNGAEAELNVTESVTATGTNQANGVYLQARNGSKASAVVGGSVTAAGSEEMQGSFNLTGGLFYEVSENASAEAVVGGSVTATGAVSGGMIAEVKDEGRAVARVAGSISGDYAGIGIMQEDRGVIDILVEDTVKGGVQSVTLATVSSVDDITLTVWKAEVTGEGDDAKIVGVFDAYYDAQIEYYEMIGEQATAEMVRQARQDAVEKAAEVEKNIRYIIRVEDPGEGGSFTLTGTQTDDGGRPWANENDRVTLKTLVQDGYRLLGGSDGTNALLQDPSTGEYYLVVPKGGGVYVTIQLEKIKMETEPSAPAESGGGSGGSIGGGSCSGGTGCIGSRQLKDGAWLYLYGNGSFAMFFRDGGEEHGSYAVKDGALTFTGRNGLTAEPEKDAEGNYVYSYTRTGGDVFSFTLSASFTGRMLRAIP